MQNIYDPTYVKALFDHMSGSYERMNYVTSFGFSIRWRKQFINKLGHSDKQLNVVDLLSGLGENWWILKHNFPNANFTALDFSQEMIDKSKPKAVQVFDEKIDLRCEDVLLNELPSNHYHIVTCAFGLKTFNEAQLSTLAAELCRILKPGGKFSFMEVSKPTNKYLLFSYKFYLSRLIPILGKLFLGDPSDYRMLWVYTDKFDNCRNAKKIFEENGLSVSYENYFFGCASGLCGQKL